MARIVERCKEYPRAVLRKIRRLIKGKPEPPEDPYAYVTVPKKPRPPYRSAAAVADRPED